MPTFSDISDQLAHQAIELPSWAFGNSGTRFKVFGSPGTPRTVQEKLADAAQGERADRARSEGRAAHSVGQGRGLSALCGNMRLILVWRWARSTPTRSKTTSTSSAA